MKINESKGITLIALIITIIVILILVAASIAIMIHGGLFEVAKDASDKTEKAYEKDSKIVDKIDLVVEIVRFGNIVPEKYTEETYEAYKTAAEVAMEVRDDENATQEEVDTACANLKEAKNNLEKI